MSLGNYLSKSDGPYSEIFYDFLPEEIQKLAVILKENGYVKHMSFINENLDDIQKYISLSPSQRQQKKWKNHPNSLWIRFSALQLSAATVKLVSGIYPISYIVDGGSYREFHSIVANGLSVLLLSHPFTYYPFSDKNPFFKDDV
ncbi:hypothetical protein [Sediminibacterium soli]|uniref:hypothetical protein n=1 Tax=Sediminibacterium soli TaxID=2698829 RepID=UPI00137A1299|nr:hypothetical protein [Sediminibacterium soli]NCI45035.1 hypothetical protein [Sediminibacterium soli]